MSHASIQPQSTHDEPSINIFIAFDSGYAIATAALLASIATLRNDDRPVRVFALVDAVPALTLRRIERLCETNGLHLVWLDQTDPAVEQRLGQARQAYLAAETNYPPSAYIRLCMGDLLPNEIERVIYLDTDLLLRRDIADLWDLEMEGRTMRAVIDPLIAAPGSLHLCGLPTKPDEKDLRYTDHLARQMSGTGASDVFHPSDDYFQSGLLMIDLTRFREIDAARHLMAFIERHRDLRFPDQDALNVVLRGEISRLDPRWNVTASVYNFADGIEGPYSPEVMSQVLTDPWIVHFSLRPKPWHMGCQHPYLADWEAALDTTPWAGWRPTLLRQALSRIPRARRLLAKRLKKAMVKSRAVQ